MNWMSLDIPWHRDMVAETFLGHLISTKLMKTTMVSDAAVSKVPICQTLQLNYPVFAPKMHILASRNLFLKRVTSRGQTQKAALTSRKLLKSTANFKWGETLFSNLYQNKCLKLCQRLYQELSSSLIGKASNRNRESEMGHSLTNLLKSYLIGNQSKKISFSIQGTLSHRDISHRFKAQTVKHQSKDSSHSNLARVWSSALKMEST